MESEPGTVGGFPAWAIYLLGAIAVLGVAYAVYVLLRPASTAALDKATGKFAAYREVTKPAPIGCPTPENLRLCDYYVASSAYSVFPSNTVSDYISDSILPLVIKAGARLVELDVYSDEQDQPIVGLKNESMGYD
jgi:hypothetical protein